MKESSNLVFNKLRQSIHAALRSWQSIESVGTQYLEEFLLFRNAGFGFFTNSNIRNRNILNAVIENNLADLAKHQTINADLLRRRFLDGETTLQVAHYLHLSEDQTNRRQREAMDALAKIIYGREISLRNERRESMLARMPPPTYSKFVGLEYHRQLLLTALRKPNSPLVIALVGIAGIGKTALADRLARTLISEFACRDFRWISSAIGKVALEHNTPLGQWKNLILHLAHSLTGESKSQSQNELMVRRRLKEEPVLIVIDDYEQDGKDEVVIERLRDLANPSKFLLTCRMRPSSEVGVFQVLIPELEKEDARALIRMTIKNFCLDQGEFEQDEIVDKFLPLLGGHPGALKLAANMLASLPASAVRRSFEKGKGDQVETFYRGIYERTWERLSSQAQKVLRVLADWGEISLVEIQARASLPPEDCQAAVAELMDNALLKRERLFGEPKYRVNQLTVTFVKSKLLGAI